MKKDKIIIFDTTLRDGEQCPGASLNTDEKIEIAKQLQFLGVDVIEAGFPVSSPGDFEAVHKIAKEVRGCQIAGLARSLKKDIDAAYNALKVAASPRIHVFLATSKIHMKYKLKKAESEIVKQAVEAVKYARSKVDDVEFSPEDASRTTLPFLARIVEAVISAGARTVNIPDTVGYSTPAEFGNVISYLRQNVSNIDQAIISVHCHNDLGLAVANSLSAVQSGARQIECTINGIGERAGNASLEEVVMALNTRKDIYSGLTTNIKTKQITKTSKMVSRLTGLIVQPNKAIVGSNAFAHEAGIHQDGILKNRSTYEIMNPSSVGLTESTMVLGKHSGKHAFKARLKKLKYDLEGDALVRAFDAFKVLADKKKVVYDEDLIALADETASQIPVTYELVYMTASSASEPGVPTAMVKLKKDDQVFQDAATGDGPVDALYKAMERLIGTKFKVLDYKLKALTIGKDAMGEVYVKLQGPKRISYTGRSTSTDIIEASAKAYLSAANKYFFHHKNVKEKISSAGPGI